MAWLDENHVFNPAFVARVNQKRQGPKPCDMCAERRRIANRLRPRVVIAMRQSAPPPVIPKWVRAIIEDVAERHHLHAADILGWSRKRKIATARFEAIYSVKSRKRSLSCTQIGQWFGRDHATVLHALAEFAAMIGAPPLTGRAARHAVRDRQQWAARVCSDRRTT